MTNGLKITGFIYDIENNHWFDVKGFENMSKVLENYLK